MDRSNSLLFSTVERVLKQQKLGLKAKCLVIECYRDPRSFPPKLFSAITMMLKQLNFA